MQPRLLIEAGQQLSHLRVLNDAALACGIPSGFRYCHNYAYLARLLDDRELALIADPAVRSETRAAHRQVYWKSIGLLSRDLNLMRINRRRLMETTKEWRFESLLSDESRAWRLLWTLRVAGVAHRLHVPVMVNVVQEAADELSRLLAVPVTAKNLAY